MSSSPAGQTGAGGSAVSLLDPNREFRLERDAVRLIETLFRPGDVVCLAWKVRASGGGVRMHDDYRAYEQLLAQHRSGRGILRKLSRLNAPPGSLQVASPVVSSTRW